MLLGVLKELKTVDRGEGQNSQRRGTEPGHERGLGCGPSDFLIKKVIQKSENLREGKCSPVPGLKSLS